ncbi:hypothetical protein HZ326_29870 [Fusarium oxysporum f. sp. albedinis]|nr:hypothetical protein HZ326_29870 [Fusarium oxysporum f. sp. albedinis]
MRMSILSEPHDISIQSMVSFKSSLWVFLTTWFVLKTALMTRPCITSLLFVLTGQEAPTTWTTWRQAEGSKVHQVYGLLNTSQRYSLCL